MHCISAPALAACAMFALVVSVAYGQRNPGVPRGGGGQPNAQGAAGGQRGPVGRVANAPRQQAPPNGRAQLGGPPAWFPLEPKLQQHTDHVLRFWEQHSGKIERYRCDFKRWEFDPSIHRTDFTTYAVGKIQYARPDKGLFAVTELHQGRKGPGGKIEYHKRKETDLEKWICDGRTIFEFDHRNQRVVERPLPPEMQGQNIVEGPLPFLFGAKAEQIKSRYWVRVNPNKRGSDPNQGVFWLEAVPKFKEDAASYKQIDVVIPDDDKFLPKAIILLHRDGSRSTFEFANREFNWNVALEKLKIWERAFFNPATPKGWKRFKEPLAQAAVAPPPAARPAAAPARRGGQGPGVR